MNSRRVSKKYLAPSIYSYPYWRLKSNIRFYKGVFCLFGHPLFLFCPKFKNRLRHTFWADFYRNLSVFSFTPAHGYRPSVPSIAFILQIRSESFSEACLLRNVPGTLRTIGLHIKNYSVRSTTQKIDLLPDRLTTYGAKDIDGMQVIHQTVGPWTIDSFIHIATSFINP